MINSYIYLTVIYLRKKKQPRSGEKKTWILNLLDKFPKHYILYPRPSLHDGGEMRQFCFPSLTGGGGGRREAAAGLSGKATAPSTTHKKATRVPASAPPGRVARAAHPLPPLLLCPPFHLLGRRLPPQGAPAFAPPPCSPRPLPRWSEGGAYSRGEKPVIGLLTINRHDLPGGPYQVERT